MKFNRNGASLSKCKNFSILNRKPDAVEQYRIYEPFMNYLEIKSNRRISRRNENK